MTNLCQNDKDGTPITKVIEVYHQLSTNKLTCIYSEILSIPYEDVAMDTNRTYLWLGMWGTNGHCALIKFQGTNVLVSNSQPMFDGSTNYYTFYYDFPTFFKKTYCVFQSADIDSKIRLR